MRSFDDNVWEKEHSKHPIKNLLRWSSAIQLSTERRQLVEGAGITQCDFAPTMAKYQMNKKVTSIKLSDSLHEPEKGSIDHGFSRTTDLLLQTKVT
ncbi:hypothetical protein Zmor_012818 [Zophobas morio]|mgnify:CR=1|uniref:Uncharacterized protein n=1 Tax=Zophobas morio TaxID=2755281 RepID=A0AA38ICQ8_9CUCU|nr:hypothetical protein Zmor_012818 [Zophobas morio]